MGFLRTLLAIAVSTPTLSTFIGLGIHWVSNNKKWAKYDSSWLLGDIYRPGSIVGMRDLVAMAQQSFKRCSLAEGSHYLPFSLSRQTP